MFGIGSGQRRPDQEAAYVDFVAARRARLYRAAYLLCGDAHRAEDLVQVALTKLYVAWPRVERSSGLDAYVRRSIVNASIDESRRPWRRERPSDHATLDAPAREGLTHEDSDELWAALRALAPGQRRVVVLRHYWGLSVEETATDLGISPGSVKSQTYDALARLREELSVTGKERGA
ncbi:MAG: SigE family RNA polymerase sigma factor [Nocardioides sp.]